MNIFKKLFGGKTKPESPALTPSNEHYPDYNDIVDDYPSPFQAGVIYNNREEKTPAQDD